MQRATSILRVTTLNNYLKLTMTGRPKKYTTHEDVLLARRAYNAKYNAKQRLLDSLNLSNVFLNHFLESRNEISTVLAIVRNRLIMQDGNGQHINA